MGSTIKYYVYISEAKVDMLFSQIPRSLLKKIASELSINLSVPFFGIGAGIKIKNDTPEVMRYSKLKIVTSYLEKHAEVGSVKEPKAYIKDIQTMRWGPVSDIIYFTGFLSSDSNPYADLFSPYVMSGTYFGLGGSLTHVLGMAFSNTYKPTEYRAPGSGLPAIHQALRRSITEELMTYDSKNVSIILPSTKINFAERRLSTEDNVQDTYNEMKRDLAPEQKFEFFAKILMCNRGQLFTTLLGTPIYVAFAD